MDEGECTLFLLAAMFDTSGKSVCLFVYLCEWTPSWRKESGYPINKTSADGNAQGSLSGLILSHITIEKNHNMQLSLVLGNNTLKVVTKVG